MRARWERMWERAWDMRPKIAPRGGPIATPIISPVSRQSHRVVSRSAKWGGSHLGGSSWNRPQRPNPGHLRVCWGCLGRFLGRLGHRTTAIVSTRGVRKSLEFRPGAPRDFFRLTETPVNKSKLCWYLSEMIHTVVWRIYFSETRFDFSDIPTSK